MNVSEVISFKTDLEKGHYISAIELIEMVESFNEGIERKDLLRFLETLNIFSIRLYSFNEYNGLIYYGHPEFDEKIGEKIADFLYLRENHVKDETHDVYASRLSHLETVCWHRVDLLRIEGFVSNTDIVNWGKPHILQHMYDGMTGEHFDIIASFTKNAQQDICKILGRTPLDNNTSGHSQAQTTQPAQDKELHKKIAELEKQLSKVSAELAASKTNSNEPLDERSEKSYLNTIGLLLELMTSPRAEGGQAPFPSETDIIARATSSDKSVYGQGKSKLEERFRDAKLILADTRKKS